MSAPARIRTSLGAPAAAVVGAVTLAATAVMCAAPAARLARVLPVEDGFYTLSVARQIGIGGGVTIDGHTATNGFQPLWGVLLAPPAAPPRGGPPRTPRPPPLPPPPPLVAPFSPRCGPGP